MLYISSHTQSWFVSPPNYYISACNSTICASEVNDTSKHATLSGTILFKAKSYDLYLADVKTTDNQPSNHPNQQSNLLKATPKTIKGSNAAQFHYKIC